MEKIEFAVLLDNKIKFKCTSEKDAIETANYYNDMRQDKDSPEFIASTRTVTEWKRIESHENESKKQ